MPADKVMFRISPLASELSRMQSAMYVSKVLPELLHHWKKCLLVLHYPSHIIDIAHIVKSVLVGHLMVEVV